MTRKNDTKDVDATVDLHGLTAEQMRHNLQRRWAEWRGMRCVQIIHGQGETLRPELKRWCEAMGVPYQTEPNNPGSTRIFPTRRTLPEVTLSTSLREKGLQLTPEQETTLRDPQAVERARQETLRQQREEAQRRQTQEITRATQERRDAALWQAEMARLDALDKSRGSGKNGNTPDKMRPPAIVPPAEIKHQEGYWRAELVRVADTDTPTLTKQKRTGLDKLAPPIEPKPPISKTPQSPSTPSRDEDADRALFEAEMARLAERND